MSYKTVEKGCLIKGGMVASQDIINMFKVVLIFCVIFFFKQKTAYEIGTGDWSSDVCSSDLKLFSGNIIHGDSSSTLNPPQIYSQQN